MSSLPPYSTFRTDSKQLLFPQATSHGNILSFVPPGFKQQLNVKFPDSRLAVCGKCKKNFKTRDMCRVRNTHTSAPWTTAYICITIDDSCLDAEGKYIDEPMTLRIVQWQPYAVRQPFDTKTPVCSACKRTNRTKSFCRERHKHRHLPWCTVYVLLSALSTTDAATVVAGPSHKVENGDEGENEKDNGKAAASGKSKEDASVAGAETISSDNYESDDINQIPESRTFLVKVSTRGSSMHWLDLTEYDQDQAERGPPPFEATPDLPGFIHPGHVDPSATQYFAQLAAAQHQNALQNHQQFFFNMQRRQQPFAGAPGWGGPPFNMAPPNAEGVTAGEAAAAQQQRNNPEDANGAWAAYYAQQAVAGADGATKDEAGPPASDAGEGNGPKRARIS